MCPIMSKYKCVELILLRPPIGDQTERNTIMLHKLQPTLSLITAGPLAAGNHCQGQCQHTEFK